MKGWIIACLWLASATLLVGSPLSCRYTSLGLDLESQPSPTTIRCTFYRHRWPRDGSVCRARLVTHRPADPAKPLAPLDLGGDFFRPAKPTHPATSWNRRGFWLLNRPDTPEASAPAMAPGASEVFLVGLPHWVATLLTLSLPTIATIRRRQSRINPLVTRASRP